MTKKIFLSASRVKKLDFCSFDYYCTYELKLPRTSNDGARRGTAVHLILECLQNPRHKKHYDAVSTQGLKGSAACERLVRKSMRKEGIESDFENNYQMIDEFIFTGLNFDFFLEGYDLQAPELEFKIENESPRYNILGYIDLMGLNKDKTVAKVRDYKSSKTKPSGDEKKFSIQGLMYQVAVSKLFPTIKRSFVEFMYLKFKKKPKEVFSASNDQLKGFEEYLAYIQDYVENFDFKKATSNFAAKHPLKKNLCGKGVVGMKEDGSGPLWNCPHRFPFDYYVLMENGKQVSSAMTKEELKPKDGQTIEKKSYKGCVYFYPKNYLTNERL